MGKAAMLRHMKELDPHTIRPCLVCGGANVHLESLLPPGRRQEVWRVVCACGQTSQQWSVSQGAAIRAWNRNLAQADGIAPESAPASSPASLKK
ncbi:Lar family restriction alleviation protein [Desulfovibrio sp. ZJ369]|uniref:Lar family restriction alleviation protein n=1 Tax=Desulfovibrio sp. ZJ369 TaxID=2709793 RepID=UPI001F1559AB|nr:Lar family restriction alleviation protein [Desulfovibrio sp. ZJ369]